MDNVEFGEKQHRMMHKGLNFGWPYFLPEHKIVPLKKNEVRIFDVNDTVAGRVAMVKDTVSGTSRRELPISVDEKGERFHPVLHGASDLGPVGLPWMLSTFISGRPYATSHEHLRTVGTPGAGAAPDCADTLPRSPGGLRA